MSFRLKTILGVALIEAVLLLILVVSSLNFLSSSNEAQLLQRANTTSTLFANATKNAVLATDLATLESFVDGILSNPEIVYVRIFGENLVLAEGGPAAFLAEPRTVDNRLEDATDGVFDTVVPIEVEGDVYGRIELGLSTESIQQTFSEARQWAIGIASLEIILVALFSWMLGIYLTRNLLQLREASQQIEKSGPGVQIEVNGSDEVAQVARAFNKMSQTLEGTYVHLQASLKKRVQMHALAESNRAKTEAILAASLDAIITINDKGRVVDYNEAAETIFGWSNHEITGQKLASYIIPEDMRAAHDAGMKHFLETGEGPVLGKRIQLSALHKQGHRFPIELAICEINTPEGKLFTAYLRDITQQLSNETELRLIGQAFQTSQAMFITDADARIIRVNSAFTKMTGYGEQDILGKNPRFWSSGHHDRAFYKQMWSSLLSEGQWQGEILNRRKDGELFPEFLNISAVKDAAGTTTHYVAHLIDISEHKAHEKQLLEAIEKAQQADEAKGRFLAVMSHEIRTPMNAVLGILGLLRDTPLDDNQQDLIKTGRESGEMLLAIINDILDFSKMEANKLELESTNFDLHQLLGQSIELLKARARQGGLTLSLNVHDEVPQFASGDSGRLQQILVNLISNACKFTEQGGIVLTAKSRQLAGEKFELHCEVLDTGIGIPAARLEELFDEFSMVDQTHSRSQEGTGLGLAICRQLTTLMGGQIGVESTPGKGSRFYFYVTLDSVSADQVELTEELPAIQFPSPDTRILLAEDNPANQRVIKAILGSAGLQADIASNGAEAVEAIVHLPYDIVFMDISMPLMDGMEATRRIRRLESAHRDVPVIALTAHALKGDREKFLGCGMNDYLTKPVDKGAILRCINQWTQQHHIRSLQSRSEGSAVSEPQAPTDAELSYVDEAVLQQLVRDTAADIVPELLLGYIEDSAARLTGIQQALDADDVKALEYETHTLGSSAGAHGNTALLKLARRIEALCRDGESAEAMALAPELLQVAAVSHEQLAQRAAKGFD